MQDQVTVSRQQDSTAGDVYANRELQNEVVASTGGTGDGNQVFLKPTYAILSSLRVTASIFLDNVTFHLERTPSKKMPYVNQRSSTSNSPFAWKEAIRNEYDIAPAYDYLSCSTRTTVPHIQFSLISRRPLVPATRYSRSISVNRNPSVLEHSRVETSWNPRYATTARVASDHPCPGVL
jgi:hypothetical protein